jgi:O-antigen ligase
VAVKRIGGWLAACVLVADLVFGGGTRQGFVSDTIVELVSIPLLALTIYLATKIRTPHHFRFALAGAAGIVAAPLVQLIPLPPQLWSSLPGRDTVVAAFVQAGIALPWLPISVSPETTMRSFFAVIPPVAIFLAAAVLGTKTRLTLAVIIIGFALISVALGLAQVGGGASSPLRFYDVTNYEQAVGFFANRNHFSALLYCAMPFLGACGIWLFRTRQLEMVMAAAFCVALFIVLSIGVALAASRAGLFLAFLAFIGVLAMARTRGKIESVLHGRRILLTIASLSTIVVVALFSLKQSLPQIDQVIAGEARADIAQTSWAAARAFSPVGSGFGTFVQVYQMFENPSLITSEYINRAHDDWLELWLESGVMGGVLAAGFLIWYAFMSRRLSRSITEAEGNVALMLARASVFVIGLLALHSVVDYPLRTIALSCIFAFACGCLVELHGDAEASVERLGARWNERHRQKHRSDRAR